MSFLFSPTIISLPRYLILAGLVFLLSCQQSTKESLEAWLTQDMEQKSLAMDELVRLCFHHSYKESEWNSDKNELYVEYGGSSALTFSNSKNYVPMTLLDLARKSYRTYHYGNQRGLAVLRVSLVKPFYIKNETNSDVAIQEFEVYRMKITPQVWKKIHRQNDQEIKVDPFEVAENDIPKGEFLKVLEDLQKLWLVELNEFSRVEVR
jgi:hypothetical protein